MADDTQRVFTTEINGKTVERIAHTPGDVVKLQFDGWREITGAAANKVVTAAAKDAAAAEKAAAADADKGAAAKK